MVSGSDVIISHAGSIAMLLCVFDMTPRTNLRLTGIPFVLGMIGEKVSISYDHQLSQLRRRENMIIGCGELLIEPIKSFETCSGHYVLANAASIIPRYTFKMSSELVDQRQGAPFRETQVATGINR